MYLGNKMLPLNISFKEALSELKKILPEKNWNKYGFGAEELVLIPFFYYKFHYFLEKEKNIEKTIDGLLSLNANKLEIDEKAKELIFKNLNLENDNFLLNEAPQKKFIEKEIMVDKNQVNNLLKIKTAEFFKIPKENVTISKPKKYFIPFYKIKIKLAEKEYLVSVNANDKTFFGLNEIPEREKSFLEITNETLRDLTEPKNWLKYSKELLFEVKDSSKEKITKIKNKKITGKKNKEEKIDLSFLSSKWVLVIIMLLALFLIFLALFN